MGSDRWRTVGTATRRQRPTITTRSITLPAGCAEVVDVLLDGERVFSIAPDRGADGRAVPQETPWPRALRRYLHGSTTVTLKAHVSGEVVGRRDLKFDENPARIRVVDEDGAPLVLDKWGSLKRPFKCDAFDKASLLADTSRLLGDLDRVLGVPAFVAYGTLLGAVREGHLIGHDNDVDVAYYSRFEHPADIMRESFAVQRGLHALGWRTLRRTGAFLQVHLPREDGPSHGIDLFTAYHCNGWFAVHKWVRGRLPREAVLPLGEVELEGVRLPAPNDPAALLRLTYGEGWMVPDPSFTFEYPRATRTRAEGWFGGWRREKERWRTAARVSMRADGRPSSFARYVEEQLEPGTPVVDVGCGVGADARWLAREGRPVLGLDYVANALRYAREQAASSGSPARFEEVNLYDLRSTMVTAARIALRERGSAVYVRHLLEAVWPDGRANLMLLAKTALGGGGRMFLEFHTRLGADGSTQQVEPPLLHGLDPEDVVAEVTAHGGTILSCELVDEAGRRCCRLTAGFTR